MPCIVPQIRPDSARSSSGDDVGAGSTSSGAPRSRAVARRVALPRHAACTSTTFTAADCHGRPAPSDHSADEGCDEEGKEKDAVDDGGGEAADSDCEHSQNCALLQVPALLVLPMALERLDLMLGLGLPRLPRLALLRVALLRSGLEDGGSIPPMRAGGWLLLLAKLKAPGDEAPVSRYVRNLAG